MTSTDWREFTESEHDTWRRLYSNLAECRRDLAHPIFNEGLKMLGISGDRIPDLAAVNNTLSRLTGWRGVPVAGFEEPKLFFAMLARREFPIGHFIRSGEDLSYTPAPDIFHDLYGHLPFLANTAYANFCEAFGRKALREAKTEAEIKEFDRLFWFGVEFPLIKTKDGPRIFGGGILSSFKESYYSLSDKPRVLPFEATVVRHQDFRIDRVQETLFILDNPEQLYGVAV